MNRHHSSPILLYVRIHSLQAPLTVIFGVGGVLVAGAQGAAWGMAAAFWAVVPLWWIQLRREARLLALPAASVDAVG